MPSTSPTSPRLVEIATWLNQHSDLARERNETVAQFAARQLQIVSARRLHLEVFEKELERMIGK
jgi:hypothetical protein